MLVYGHYTQQLTAAGIHYHKVTFATLRPFSYIYSHSFCQKHVVVNSFKAAHRVVDLPDNVVWSNEWESPGMRTHTPTDIHNSCLCASKELQPKKNPSDKQWSPPQLCPDQANGEVSSLNGCIMFYLFSPSCLSMCVRKKEKCLVILSRVSCHGTEIAMWGEH